MFGLLFGLLFGLDQLQQGAADHAQHEFDELGGLDRLVAAVQRGVIVSLAFANEGFDGHSGEQGDPTAEDECLPKASHASVAVLEGMNELELVVEDATGDQRMFRRALEQSEEVGDQCGYQACVRGEVDDLLSTFGADATGAEASRPPIRL